LGLDEPAASRFFAWAGGALRGDFGMSADGQRSIAEVVALRARNSAVLAAAAAVIGIPLAILLGVVTALWRDRPIDIGLSAIAIFAMTIPEFVSATLLILVFSVWLGWLPGVVIVSADVPVGELLRQIVLPVVTASMVLTAHILRMVRTSVIEVLASDHVQMARLKGVPYWRMVFRHVLPSALLPAINVIALTLAWLLGGLVVIEVVFNYPGLGRLMIESISHRNLPVVQAIALILGLVYVGVNLAADVLTILANPRLRTLHSRRR
ncbi:MAG: ABC transporter permease, partial [Planctomycetes bacterium]|nr:ABC transporter permease [Planctomycetota bacterium]